MFALRRVVSGAHQVRLQTAPLHLHSICLPPHTPTCLQEYSHVLQYISTYGRQSGSCAVFVTPHLATLATQFYRKERYCFTKETDSPTLSTSTNRGRGEGKKKKLGRKNEVASFYHRHIATVERGLGRIYFRSTRRGS